ncbi:MAG: NADPH-dependent assimilatory sulfite reductase hemoprotein subunit [Verrucomicrobiota bacterium]|nr:NADPH-dependent assimilatory sulfite reductase hemoprotein subunit [Limisphaera sp.]MDW8380597.1 NADPH-dependent assimilatory sulfite reductase hemoprotein subunit [Verrucomicrobiota bacterium]
MNAGKTESGLTRNEALKTGCPTLAGTIAATLANPDVDHFSDEDYEFLKFHGVYQQDDRDLRKSGKKYIFMVRGRIPGGVMTPHQWAVFDELATRYGNNTLRITTRQSIQFHGVVKSGLRPLIHGINECLLSTLAACGDVNRNVMAPPTPAYTPARAEVFEDCRRVADALKPRTPAYHTIWVNGIELDLNQAANRDFMDPLYGAGYLPRKFKTAFVIPPINDVDILTNDLGFIAIVENGQLVGYNVAVGGGMGRSHGNAQTYPRLADVLGFLPRERLIETAKAVLTIHRDFGDRTNRKHARLKYVVAERGIDWTRAEVEARAGFKLQPPRPFQFTTTGDLLGWHRQVDGRWFFTVYVESGRVKDLPHRQLKTALRRIADRWSDLEFRLTPNQNLILANVPEPVRPELDGLLREHGVCTDRQTTVIRAAALSCPALPTCGLALAESERFLPSVLDRLEAIAAELGLQDQEIIVRMTGCPNGCARPYMAEIGLVGKAPGRYQVWLGGNEAGTRLNRLWKDTVKDVELEAELRSLLEQYRKGRHPHERFGDWAVRVLWPQIEASVPAS